MIDIAICIPIYNEIQRKCVDSINALNQLNDFNFILKVQKGCDLVDLRNILLRENLDSPFILFVDSDISFKPKDFERIYNKMILLKCGIIGAKYCFKHRPDLSMAAMWDKKYPGFVGERLPMSAEGFRRVDATGTGFMLIDTKILKPDLYPWVRKIIHKTPTEYGHENTGDDYGFCLHMKKAAGINTFVDFDTEVKHLIREDEKNQKIGDLQKCQIPKKQEQFQKVLIRR